MDRNTYHASDLDATATHLTEMLGLPGAQVFGPLRTVELTNQVSLDGLHLEIITDPYGGA